MRSQLALAEMARVQMFLSYITTAVTDLWWSSWQWLDHFVLAPLQSTLHIIKFFMMHQDDGTYHRGWVGGATAAS